SVLHCGRFLARRIRLSADLVRFLPCTLTWSWSFLTQKEKLRFSKFEIAVESHWQRRHLLDDSWFYALTRSLTGRSDSQKTQSAKNSNKPHPCNKAGFRSICQFGATSYGTVAIQK